MEVSVADSLLRIELQLVNNLNSLLFADPVAYVYSPIEYAYDVHSKFVKKFCDTTKTVLFLGMNPGPWGMSQTGVPFGEVSIVKDWFQITGIVHRPHREHPDRPVMGLSCQRSEVSGKRFWGLFRDICIDPHTFFEHSFVYNHCPLAFMTKKGRNITPSELKANQRKQLIDFCDAALLDVVKLLKVKFVVGIGKFAEKRAIEILQSSGLAEVGVLVIPHPSPQNFGVKDWKGTTLKKLEELNLMQYLCHNTAVT